MNITKHARVHRFHDYVAVSVGDADTEYLTPEIARKLAVALARYADDAERRKFTDPGGLGTHYIEAVEVTP